MGKFRSEAQRRMAQFLEAAGVAFIYVPERVGPSPRRGPCFALVGRRAYLYESGGEVVLPPTADAGAERFEFSADGRFAPLGRRGFAAVMRCPSCREMFFSARRGAPCPSCGGGAEPWALGSDGIPGWDGERGRPLFDGAELESRVSSLPEDGMAEGLRAVAALLSGRPDEAVLTREKARRFGELARNYPNMAGPLRHLRASLVRTKLRRSKAISFRPMLLVGSPGCGKSSFASELGAIASGRDPVRVDLGNDVASFTLAGSDMSWRKAKCGLVLQSMFARGGGRPLRNPVVILDELDKIPPGGAHDVEGVFYSILERETASRFRDNYFDVAVDASGINYVATANDLSRIPPAILSRFETFEIRDYTERELAERVIPHFYSRWVEFERIDRASVPASLSMDVRLQVLAECGRDARRVPAALDRVLERTGRMDGETGRFIALFSESEISGGWRRFAGSPVLPETPFPL